MKESSLPIYKEYYLSLDSSGKIEKKRLIKTEEQNKKQRKSQDQYRELLLKAEPIFDLNRYHEGFISEQPNAKMVTGRPSYFVVKDIDGKKYSEYYSSSVTIPVPINANLWVYIVKRLSNEIVSIENNIK